MKSKASNSATKKLLLLGQGPDGHPPQTHEYMDGLKVLANELAKVPEVETITVKVTGKWSEGPELIDRVDGVVLFLAEGAKWLSQDAARLQAFQRLAARGGGRVVLHWAMGTKDEKPIEVFVDVFGGCHGGPDRKYKVLTTEVKVASTRHAITRGIKEFSIKDEFYYKLKLAKSAQSLVQAKIDDEWHTVAWAYSPAKRGRAFGFSGLHFHENWKREEYRRLVTQGVLWSVGVNTERPMPLSSAD
jgi:type 1 glutamine amidotransferase